MHTAKTAGFRWLPSYYEAVRDLPDAERLKMYDAMADFGFGNETAELPPLLSALFHLITPTLEKSVCFFDRQKANGAKGGRKPKQNPDETQTEATAFREIKPTEKRESEGDSEGESEGDGEGDREGDSESKCVCEKAKPRAARFTPPNLDEVREYCLERGNGIDPRRFLDFYTAKGWRIGKERMKDWRAAVRTWEGRDANGRDHGHGDTDPEIPGVLCIS